MKLVELPTFKRSVAQSVIDVLESVLLRAREGEVTSVAIACVLDDGASFTGYSKTDQVQHQIGAVEILKHKLIREVVLGEDE